MRAVNLLAVFIIGLGLGIFGQPELQRLVSSLNRPTEDEVKIGALLCLSGNCAEWGTESLRGIRLAIDQINSTGGLLGKKINLVVQDSREDDPAQAVTAFKQLTEIKKINYIIGPTWTPAGLAIAPLAKRQKQLIITSPSVGVKEFNEAADNIFNLWPHDEVSTRKLANHAFNKGLLRAAIFSSEQPWTKTQSEVFETEFKRLGGQIVERVDPPDNGNDYKAEALRIVNSHPDVILFSCLDRSQSLASKEVAKLGYKGVKLSVLMDQNTLNAAEGTLEGVIFARYPEANSKFKQLYAQTYKAQPGVSADTGYDVMQLYATAIQRANSTEIGKVLNSIKSIAELNGASGKSRFDGRGGVARDPILYHIHDNQMVLME